MKKEKTICFVAGKSGGHIIPALTLAQKAREKHEQTHILFFSTASSLDKKITEATSTINQHISLALENVPYKRPWRFPIFFWQLIRSFFSALKYLQKNKPETVISTGGYIAIPVCLAARILRIPIELFELNVLPGKATTFLAPFAQIIHLCFEETQKNLSKKSCKLAEYPIRYKPVENAKQAQEIAINKLELDPSKKTVLVLGGSQGSLNINTKIKKWVSENPQLKDTMQIIHQTGALDQTNWQTFYTNAGIKAVTADFFNDLETLYQAADLVVCRSGAGSLFETIFFKKPCITIPLETKSNTHQVHNALAMRKRFPSLVEVIRHKAI